VTIAITVGNGLTRPTGIYTPIPDPAVDNLARILSELPSIEEGWWSGHLWKDNLRRANLWLATAVITLDVDYETDGEPFPEHRDALVENATTARLPGSLFHLTPHGARVIFALDRPYSDRKDLLAASAAAVTLVSDAITGSGYKVDEPVTRDLARLYFTPNAKAKGVARRADVIVMRREQYTAAQLIADATPAPKPTAARKPRLVLSQSFEQAAAQWVSDHSREYDKKPGRCPVCDDSGSFHQLPDHIDRWYCFSTDHVEVGIKGNNGFHGDALDLEAHERRCKPVDVLRADGYLGTPQRPAAPPLATGAAPATEPEPEATPAPAGAFRPWRSRSYLTAVSIIEANARDVLEGRKLELNEMTGRIELGRVLLKDADESRVRANIEARFTGGLDKNNNEIGLQLSLSDVSAAIAQIAHDNSYHPVREYLNRLKWDGVERLDHVAGDILRATDTPLNRLLVRKFFISAVARPMNPGCKVDTVIILVGEQGLLKSTFFRTIAYPWFDDTAIDLAKKDAFESLRNSWILEWAELESLLRARDTNSVKAFLSSPKDTYRPSYGRNVIEVKRSGVIVGSTNHREFLSDETGARRFHPIVVGVIDIAVAAEQRDQLWAEAVHRFRAGETWWLTPEDDRALEGIHEEHRVRDAWEERVLNWAETQDGFTTAEVLRGPIGKDVGQWTKGDEMRIAKILKSNKYERKTDPTDVKRKAWRRV